MGLRKPFFLNIRKKVLKNKLINRLYKTVFYFELGKGQVARIYSWIPDLLIIIAALKYLFNIDFTKTQIIIVLVSIVFLNIILGYFLKHSGLWDVDKIVQAKKNPVMEKLYESAQKILGKP